MGLNLSLDYENVGYESNFHTSFELITRAHPFACIWSCKASKQLIFTYEYFLCVAWKYTDDLCLKDFPYFNVQ